MTYSMAICSFLSRRYRKAKDPEQTPPWYSRHNRRTVSAIGDEDLKLQRLSSMFPEHSGQSLGLALTRSGGSVEAAAEQLFSGNNPDEKERGILSSTLKEAAQTGDKDGWEKTPWEISASGGESSSTETHVSRTGNAMNNRASPVTEEAISKLTTEYQQVGPGKGKKGRGLSLFFLFSNTTTALIFCFLDVISYLLFLFVFVASVGMFLFSCESENTGVTQGSETETKATDHDLIECGCCFGDIPFEKCTFCGDGHLFCMDCARRNAEQQIGMRRTELKCLDTSGCQFAFSHSEIRRFLPPKLYEAFMRVVQAEELQKANLPGLVSCPFCDYAAIVPVLKTGKNKNFQCENPGCKIVSCRACQGKAHAPISCKQERKLAKEHKIEEAMTDALLRECPKCKRKFYKTEGCNFMTCLCGQAMCYICRTPIKNYDHFTNACVLFDDTIKRNANDVAAAEKEARQGNRHLVDGGGGEGESGKLERKHQRQRAADRGRTRCLKG